MAKFKDLTGKYRACEETRKSCSMGGWCESCMYAYPGTAAVEGKPENYVDVCTDSENKYSIQEGTEMKSYKEYGSMPIGASDIATLILVGCDEKGLKTEQLSFGSDGSYRAYIVDGDAEIGAHYKKVASFECWLKIYDDEGLTYRVNASQINVYRAAEMGCIIQAIN